MLRQFKLSFIYARVPEAQAQTTKQVTSELGQSVSRSVSHPKAGAGAGILTFCDLVFQIFKSGELEERQCFKC